MYENGRMQTVSVDFSRKREPEPFISRTLVRRNMLDCKRAGQSRRQAEATISCVFELHCCEELTNKS